VTFPSQASRSLFAYCANPAHHHLADALDVSERTVKRDMAALRKAGVDLPPSRR